MKIKETATIISQECLCRGVYSMWLKTNAARYATPGQFISVYPNSDSMLLPRPVSICETDGVTAAEKLRIVYRIAGKGTEMFSHMTAGETIDILGPVGNGFLQAAGQNIGPATRALLVGGGIGIPPMLELAKRLECNVTTVAGYRSREDMFLTKELECHGRLLVATDDGSYGTGGTVIDAIESGADDFDIVFACGPKPMLRGIRELGIKRGVPVYVSMEERMACGVGVCLGCVCGSTEKDDHSKVNNKRVCVDGPVFNASEVDL